MNINNNFIIRIVLFLFAFIFIGFGLFLMGNHYKEKRFYSTTDAVIVAIDTDHYVDVDYDGVYSESDHYVYVDYVVDGVKYEDVLLNRYDISMYVGKVIKINYDTRDPYRIGDKNSNLIGGIVFMGMGSVAITCALVTLLKSKKVNAATTK